MKVSLKKWKKSAARKKNYTVVTPQVARFIKDITPIKSQRMKGRGPIPPSIIVKLKYSDCYTSNGTQWGHIWNINSIFDPDRTGTGHQPYGHDTYQTLYNRYRVLSVKYKIHAQVTETANNSAHKGTLLFNNDGGQIVSTFNTRNTAIEMPGARTKTISANKENVWTGTVYPNVVTGASKSQYASDDKYDALMGADPSEVICMHFYHSTLTNTVLSAGFICFYVVLDYEVELFDPKDLSQS